MFVANSLADDVFCFLIAPNKSFIFLALFLHLYVDGFMILHLFGQPLMMNNIFSNELS